MNVHGRTQGWTDEQLVSALLWLNISGWECIDDIRILEADEGLSSVIFHILWTETGRFSHNILT